jgi:ABC-type transport system substrate-binding protein
VTNLMKLAVVLLALSFVFAIKPHYGGEVTLRLNEPTDFSYAPSSYSNLIFYSLIYENFFILKNKGDISTNIFKEYSYDNASRKLMLLVKDNIRFSDGTPITGKHVKVSLTLFLDKNLATSRKLRRLIKSIKLHRSNNTVLIELLYDAPDIISSLTAPELVLLSSNDQGFSGCFFPDEWVKGQYILLRPNPFYPGGRGYLDSLKVIFYDLYYPDVFLSQPGMINKGFDELKAGVYQNIYLGFPQGKVGTNTRVALYSLLKDFYIKNKNNLVALNALTSNEESPVTLNIRSFSNRKVRSILRSSRIKLFILSSLKGIEESFNQFISKKRLSVETIYLSDNQLASFTNNNSVRFLLLAKTFNRRMPIDEKLKVILKELSFNRFNESYLQLLNQLEEVKNLKNEELLIDLASEIIEKIIKDGFILPLYQRRYSIYVKDRIKGIELDFYGKPIFGRVRIQD